MRKLVLGIADAMQGTMWVIVLTFIVLYMFAILFTTLVGHGVIFQGTIPDKARETFGTVEQSMYMLFKLMNDDQSVVAFTESVWLKLMFMLSMVVLNWVMLATLTSVVTEHMRTATTKAEAAAEQEEEQRKTQVKRGTLVNLFQEIDADQNGCIDQEEFQNLLLDDMRRKELCSASGLKDTDLADLFEYLSEWTADGRRVIWYEDFVTKMHQEAEPASERTVFRLEEQIRSMERLNEKRFEGLVHMLTEPVERREGLLDGMNVYRPTYKRRTKLIKVASEQVRGELMSPISCTTSRAASKEL